MARIDILNTDLEPLDLTFTAIEAGQDSDVLSFALRNATEEDAFDVLLVLQVEDLTNPGTYLSAGLPPQDEQWARIRLVDQDNTGAPAQQPLRTDWQPVGAYSAFLVRDVLAGGVRIAEIKMRPPSSAVPLSYRWGLSTLEAEHARPLPPAVTAAARGILTHLGDFNHSGVVSGCAVTPSDPPDEDVHVAAGTWIHRGRPRAAAASTHTLDQQDGAGEALEAGESYWAALSLGDTGVTVTKGARAALDPVQPTVPEADALLRYALVQHQAGDSEIEEEDLAGRVERDRYYAEPGSGLELLVHPGQALGGATWRYHSATQSVVLPATSTRWLWQLANGDLVLAEADEVPETTALGPWWRVETDATGVVDLVDLRTYTDPPVVLSLGGALPDDPGDVASLPVFQDLAVERVVYRLTDNGGGSAGETALDLLRGVESFHPTEPPAFTFDAATLTADAPHELAELRSGDTLTLVTTAHPTGGTPARAEVYLICRRLA